jgi:hypothetical protein
LNLLISFYLRPSPPRDVSKTRNQAQGKPEPGKKKVEKARGRRRGKKSVGAPSFKPPPRFTVLVAEGRLILPLLVCFNAHKQKETKQLQPRIA